MRLLPLFGISAWLVLATVACDKKPDATAAPATSASGALSAAATLSSATASATSSATGTAAAGSHASYTFVCTLKPGSVYLAEGSAGSGPKDPDPARAVGEATFVLTQEGVTAIGTGTGVLGDLVVQGAADGSRLAIAFGPKENVALAFRGTLDVDAKTGGTLRASTGNGDSVREGACVVKP